MKKKIVNIICLIMILFISRVSFAEVESEDKIQLVSDYDSFYKMIPESVNNNTPLIIDDGLHSSIINEFSNYYNYNGFINETNLSSKNVLMIMDSSKSDYLIIGTQIAAKLNAEIKYYKDKIDNINFDEYSVVYELTDGRKVYEKSISISDSNELTNFYDEIVKSPSINVIVEDEAYAFAACYYATLRNGKIYSNLSEVEDKSLPYAYFTSHNNYSVEKNNQIYDFAINNNSTGVGIFTGSTETDVNLMILKSYYYRRYADNAIQNNIVFLSGLDAEVDESIKKEKYNTINISGTDLSLEHITNQIKESTYVNIYTHGNYSGLSFGKNDLDNKNFPLTKPTIIVAEACKTGMIWYDDSIAMKAIANGAVCYIGSTKVGGVNGFTNESYLMSSDEYPLGVITLLNNKYIKDNFDSNYRAVLIGDPLFGMNKSLMDYSGKSLYYELPYELFTDYQLPIVVNNNNQEYRAVKIKIENRVKYYNLLRLNNDSKYYMIDGIDKTVNNGTIDLLENPPIQLIASNLINHIIQSEQIILSTLCTELFGVINVMILVFLTYIKRSSISSNKKLIFLSVLISMMINIFIFKTYDYKINFMSIIFYILLAQLIITETRMWMKILIIIVPYCVLLLILMTFNQINAFYKFGLISLVVNSLLIVLSSECMSILKDKRLG